MVNQLIQKKGKKPIMRNSPLPVSPYPQSPYYKGDAVADYETRLKDGLTNAGFDEGLKVFQGLKQEHDSLSTLFSSSGVQDTLINSDRVRKLMESLYQQGLSLLLQTLDISQQLGKTNIYSLELENKELQEDLEKCATPTLRSMITERLDKNTKSLKLVKGYRDKLDEIFCQVGLCKDSIRQIRLELPELLSHKPKDEMDKTLLELRTRIEFAQRVHEEYERQGL